MKLVKHKYLEIFQNTCKLEAKWFHCAQKSNIKFKFHQNTESTLNLPFNSLLTICLGLICLRKRENSTTHFVPKLILTVIHFVLHWLSIYYHWSLVDCFDLQFIGNEVGFTVPPPFSNINVTSLCSCLIVKHYEKIICLFLLKLIKLLNVAEYLMSNLFPWIFIL